MVLVDTPNPYNIDVSSWVMDACRRQSFNDGCHRKWRRKMVGIKTISSDFYGLWNCSTSDPFGFRYVLGCSGRRSLRSNQRPVRSHHIRHEIGKHSCSPSWLKHDAGHTALYRNIDSNGNNGIARRIKRRLDRPHRRLFGWHSNHTSIAKKLKTLPKLFDHLQYHSQMRTRLPNAKN